MRAPSSPLLLALLLTAGCGTADDPLPVPGEPAFAPAADRFAEVASVPDGETLELEGGQRVRLLGVDAPDEGAVCAAEARERLARLTEGRRVALDVCEPAPADQPVSQGEVTAYVVIPGESFVNLELLRAGLANPRGVGHCGGPPAQERLEAGRAEAERERRGLFARGACRVVPVAPQPPAAPPAPPSAPPPSAPPPSAPPPDRPDEPDEPDRPERPGGDDRADDDGDDDRADDDRDGGDGEDDRDGDRGGKGKGGDRKRGKGKDRA
jgi:endonuclease YncB( thermonuclease family)